MGRKFGRTRNPPTAVLGCAIVNAACQIRILFIVTAQVYDEIIPATKYDKGIQGG